MSESTSIRARVSDINVIELSKRVWAFWNQDHLLGTLLGLFVITFAKWMSEPSNDLLKVLITIGAVLVGITAIKFVGGYFSKKQEIIEIREKGWYAKDIAEKHVQMQLSDKMSNDLFTLYNVLLTTLAEVFDDGEITPEEAKVLFATYKKTFASMKEMISNATKSVSLVFEDFVEEHFRKPFAKIDSPSVDNQPEAPPTEKKSEMEILTESLDSGDSELLDAAKAIDKIADLNATSEELKKDTEHMT